MTNHKVALTDMEYLHMENERLREQIRSMEADHKNEVQDLNYEIQDLRSELRAALDELYDNQLRG